MPSRRKPAKRKPAKRKPAKRKPAGAARAAPRPAGARTHEQLVTMRSLLRRRYRLLAEMSTRGEELATRTQATAARAEQDMAAARGDLEALFQLAPFPYFTLTSAAVISSVNINGMRFLGRDASAIVGKPMAIFVAAEDRRGFRQHVAACRRQLGTSSIEVTLQLPDGLVPVELSTSQTRDGWIYTALVDLRERRRAEAERRELAVREETARTASEAKDQFIAALSHELRTPLAPVMVAVAALERLCADGQVDAAELFATIRRNLTQEVRLIDDLLDVTRLEHGKLRLRDAVIDVHLVVLEALDQVRAEAASKGVRHAIDLAAARHHVRGDADRLQQVFVNLLRNAIKFTPGQGLVAVSSQDLDDQLSISVADTGVGIAPADKARIFDRFMQGATVAPREGLGLGLAIAQGLVTKHGGRIDARSAGVGQGATFQVVLPSVDAPGIQPAAASPAPAALAPAPLAGKRILVVEDHPDTGRLMTQVLRQARYEVALADSVASALAHADEPLDLLVSDIGLPDGSGLDLMRQLRARRPVPGIVISGYGSRDDIKRSRAAGFQHHLVKPVDVPVLLRAIADLLQPPAQRP